MKMHDFIDFCQHEINSLHKIWLEQECAESRQNTLAAMERYRSAIDRYRFYLNVVEFSDDE